MSAQRNDFRRSVRGGESGFTLVELLVVILIIAVLSALGFFALTRSRNAAMSAADMNRLRALGPAIAVAGTDEGRFPFSYDGGTCWMDPVRKGMGLHYSADDTYTIEDVEPFISARLNVPISSDTANGKLRSLKHYSAAEAVMPMRDNEVKNKGYLGVPVYSIKRPVELVLLVDALPQNSDDELKSTHSNLWHNNMRSRWFLGQSWPAPDKEANARASIDPEVAESKIDFRHDGKAHVLFVDGHVESLRPNEFVMGMFSNAY